MVESRLAEPRVVCVGTNLESKIALGALIDAGANVVALVTRPAGNIGSVCDFADLHQLCESAGVVTIDTLDINSRKTVDTIRSFEPDYLYTLGWSQLFRNPLLESAKYYVVGSHPTALPFGRGRAPVPWTILEQVRESAVSLFRMTADADDGNLLFQQPFSVPEGAYAEEVYSLVANSLGKAFASLYELHRLGGDIREVKQDPLQASYRAKRSPEDGRIDFHRPAEEIVRLVRSVSHPYPGAYTYWNEHPVPRKVTFWRASTDDVPRYRGVPGQILLCDGERLLVQASDTPFWCWDLSIDDARASTTLLPVGYKLGIAVEDEVASLRKQVCRLEHQLDCLIKSMNARVAA